MLQSVTRSTVRSASKSLQPRKRIATSSQSSVEGPSKDDQSLADNAKEAQASQKSTKTVAEADAEMMRKLAGMSGEGGEAGIEYEDGKPVAMKRSVKNNMFRLI